MADDAQQEREELALKFFTAMVAASPRVDPASREAHGLAESAFKFVDVWLRRRDRERTRIRPDENG